MTEGDDRTSRRMFLRRSAGAALPERAATGAGPELANVLGASSRRVFLGGSAAAALVLAVPAWTRSAAAATRSALGLAPRALTRARFKPVLGATLRMSGEGKTVDAVLAEIADIAPVARADDPNRFSLLLHVAGGYRPRGGIKTLRHPDLGEVALFVSPVNQGVKPAHYEAVINRSRS
jgi:hypothetical protein